MLIMSLPIELDSHVEFQLSLLRLTAATAEAAKSVKAETWSENAQNLEGLAQKVRVGGSEDRQSR